MVERLETLGLWDISFLMVAFSRNDGRRRETSAGAMGSDKGCLVLV